MKTIGQVNTKNRQNYFLNDMTTIKSFYPSLLDIDQVSFGNNDSVICETEYVKHLDSSDSLYHVFNNVVAYIGKSGENKYLIFASTDKNGKALEHYT